MPSCEEVVGRETDHAKLMWTGTCEEVAGSNQPCQAVRRLRAVTNHAKL